VERRRWLMREAPLLVGLLVAALALLWPGSAFRAAEGFAGASWEQYRGAAHLFFHPEEGWLAWPLWRQCLYPGLLGLLGEPHGYLAAASWIASGAALLIVLAAGLGARALANPTAGGVAALHAALFPELLQGVWRMDVYPSLGAAFGLALALGACSARWGRIRIMALCGLAAGLAWGLDSRGFVAVVPCAALVALGAWRMPWSRRGLAALAFAGCLALGPLAQHLLRPPAQVRYDVEEAQRGEGASGLLSKLEGQLIHAADDIQAMGTRDPTPLTRACGAGAPRTLGAAARLGPCTRGMLRHNLGTLQRGGSLPASWLLGLLLLGGLLPHRRRPWRSALASALLLGSCGVAVLIMGSLALVHPAGGYFFPFLAPVAMLAPVALHRLASLVGAGPRWRSLAPLAGLGITLLLWPGVPDRERARPVPNDPREAVFTWLRELVEPGETVLDCADLYVNVALLPLRTATPEAARERSCERPRPLARPHVQWLLVHPGREDPAADGWVRVEGLEALRSSGFEPPAVYRSPGVGQGEALPSEH
jgi:hypothetical protein